MTDWPGLGIVSPLASRVPGRAAWIVSVTAGVGSGAKAVGLGIGMPSMPLKLKKSYAPARTIVPRRT